MKGDIHLFIYCQIRLAVLFKDSLDAPFLRVLVIDGEECELPGAAVQPVRPHAEVGLGAARAGANCLKISLPGKLILGN